MESIRVSAKTVDDALTEASIELGTSRDNIEYTVIDEGSKGFFGIGGRKATIEAKKKVTDEDLMKEIFEEKPQKPKKESKKEEKSETKKESSRKESRSEGKNGGKKEDSRESGKDLKKESKQEFKQEKKDVKDQKKAEKKEEKKEEKKTEKKEAKREPDASVRAKSIDSRKESGREEQKDTKKNHKGSDWKGAVVKEEAKNTMDDSIEMTEKTEDEETRIPKTPADPEEAKQRAITFISDVLQAMGMEDQITAEFEDDILCVNIEGEDMGIMIGKRGQTLDSLQYLTSLVVNKGKSSYTRVKVDTEDYRNRRKATLENLAKNIAMKVKKTRRPVFLEPMNPYERRIIHSALQNDPYVTTHSEGEEPYRKVVVTLKKDRERDDRDRDRDHGRSRGYSRYNNNRRGRYERSNYNRHTYDRENFEDADSEIVAEQQEFSKANESMDQSEE